MSQNLRAFYAALRSDSVQLSEFFCYPEAVMDYFGLTHEEQALILRGDPEPLEKLLAEQSSAAEPPGSAPRRGTTPMPLLLVLGTRNSKKRKEIVELLGDLNLELGDLTQFPHAPEVVEDGTTFEANARKKATELARTLGQWVLGEDSGLVVPALDGRPGVYSARYAGQHGDDEANNDLLLSELAPLPDACRAAYYVCTVALAAPTGEIRAVTEGRCHGIITKERRGTGGFGYDPLFLIPELHRTFGELSPRVKHALSHRARAFERLRPRLRQLLTQAR